VYAFLYANTSLTKNDVRELTDAEIGDVLELPQFRPEHDKNTNNFAMLGMK
jgi:hypothetical protein